MRGESQLFFLGVNIAAELHTTGKIRAMAVATVQAEPGAARRADRRGGRVA